MKSQTCFILLSLVWHVTASPLFWGGGQVDPTATIKNIPKTSEAAVAQSPVVKAGYAGKMTYYGTNPNADPGPNRSYGACGFEPSRVAGNYAAMNAVQYQAGMCGQCISISYGNNCAEAVVVDRCGGCPSSGLDVSLDIFATLVGSKAEAERLGVVNGVRWNWVVCGAGCPV